MNKAIEINEIQLEDASIGDTLAKPVKDTNGQILLNEDVCLTESHLKSLANQKIQTVQILKTIIHTPEEERIRRVKILDSLKKKFDCFEKGKKRDSLIKLFFIYQTRKNNE